MMDASLVLEDLSGRPMIYDSDDLMFKLSFTVVFLWMVHNKELSKSSRVKYQTFLKGPTGSDLFSLCSQKKWKAAINCPKIVTYTVKIVKFLVRVISEHSLKAISVMFESGTFGSCLVQKLKSKGVGEGGGGEYINHLFVIR